MSAFQFKLEDRSTTFDEKMSGLMIVLKIVMMCRAIWTELCLGKSAH